jgi:hypothetical protein
MIDHRDAEIEWMRRFVKATMRRRRDARLLVAMLIVFIGTVMLKVGVVRGDFGRENQKAFSQFWRLPDPDAIATLIDLRNRSITSNIVAEIERLDWENKRLRVRCALEGK